MKKFNRRSALRTAAGTLAAGMGTGLDSWSFLGRVPAVSAQEASAAAVLAPVAADIEPLVTLLESTPRDDLLEQVAARIQNGTSYREVLAALLLAAVRNVQPRPSVGFKFHAVLVVNSAHLASLSSPDSDRWLPIFWALDYFKARQLEEERVSGWKLRPVDERVVPGPTAARTAFVQAMDRWDVEAADAAVTGLCRSAGANEVYELLYRYGARDYRSIGHKAIYVANSWRTLQCIGWNYAEPVLRSLTYALLNHNGEPNPARSDLAPDRPWRTNQELADKIPVDWQAGEVRHSAVSDMLAVLRAQDPSAAARQAADLLTGGVSPQTLWDAVFVSAGELLRRRPGIIGLHALTTANALHYAYQATADDRTRRLLLLQNCSFMPMFVESAYGRGRVADTDVSSLEPIRPTTGNAVGEIFADVSQDRHRAAGKVLAYLNEGGDAEQLVRAARQLVFAKGDDAHDYKYSSAVLENYRDISRPWRDTFMALSVYNLRGAGDRDNRLVERIRAAFG